MTPRYSLVMPIYNEQGNILPLIEASVAVLDGFADSSEIVLVDDGSVDGSVDEIAVAVTRWPRCRALTHPRNLGQNHALLTGLRAARGAIICTMDGDGQNDPRDLPLLVAPLEAAELDLACGWRFDRQDSWLRRWMSRLANAVSRRILHHHLHDNGCQLRAMRREVVAALFPFELLQSFLPAIAVAKGFKVGEIKVRHNPRRHGRAKYGLRQLWWRPAVAMFRLRCRLHP